MEIRGSDVVAGPCPPIVKHTILNTIKYQVRYQMEITQSQKHSDVVARLWLLFHVQGITIYGILDNKR